jgi:hypothetical protein
MKNKMITKLVPLRYKLDTSLSKTQLITKNRLVAESNVKKLLEKDATKLLNNKSTELQGFMRTNRFAQFDGDIKNFVSDIERRDELSFLLLLYVGKVFNHLKSYYFNIDLSFLAFANKLNAFAKKVETLSGKTTKIVIATENGLLDKYVLGISPGKSLNMVAQAKEIIRKFSFDKLEFKPLSLFLPKNFGILVRKELRKLTNKPLAENSKELREVFNVFFLSFPTKSFKQAVQLYTDKKQLKKINQWAFKATLRYIAFTKARYNWGFWERYKKDYIRSSVSPKSGIVNFEYHVGRVTPPHGVAVVEQESIGTEYFYDLVKSCKIHRKKLVLYRFNNLPFFFSTNRI